MDFLSAHRIYIGFGRRIAFGPKLGQLRIGLLKPKLPRGYAGSVVTVNEEEDSLNSSDIPYVDHRSSG
ncbi:hypothetical protein M513_09335 [Trichuris suis]|uniref:Uncharacterized protein n=1 Tax=Trichuris suis TaxID=68888 RepID=A0A085LY22_9BILA|nr:hypothetical protein M513_09335 [Trichuris suis]